MATTDARHALAARTDPARSQALRALLDLVHQLTGLPTPFIASARHGRLTVEAIRSVDGSCPLRAGDELPLPDAYCQRVVGSAEPLAVPDARGSEPFAPMAVTRVANIGAYIGVPLVLSGGELYGTLGALDARPRQFAARDTALLQALARLATFVIEHDDLRALAERNRRSAELLASVGRALSSSVDLPETLARTVESTRSVFGARGAVLFLVGDGGTLELGATSGARAAAVEAAVAARALATREIAFVEDTGATPDAAYTPLADGARPGAVYATPLFAGDKPVAVVEALFAGPRGPIAGNLALARMLANQAATAIENARLHHTVVAERARFEALLRGMSEGLGLIDARERVTFWNEQCAKIYGIAAAAVVGKPAGELLARSRARAEDPEAYGRLVADALARLDDEPTIEFVLTGPPRRVVQAHDFPVHDPGGQFIGRGHLARDVTADRSYLEQLERLNKVKSDFVSIVSHEFRTPLTGIQGFSELMRDEDLTMAEMKEFAADINRDAQRLNRLIGQMLDLDRMEAGKMAIERRQVDLNAVVAEVVGLAAANAPQHRFRPDLDPALPLLAGDRDKLVQVVTNLVGNAVKYSPAGGEIAVGSKVEGNLAHVQVRDQGLGIPPEALEEVFERYARVESSATRQIQGTGLGLPIARQIVQMHGGRIWAESPPGRGAVFHFTIPLAGTGTLAAR
jgi:signal transduction histidine kinase